MNVLKPQPPFVWPEPRVHTETAKYEHKPPFFELALDASFMFGIVSSLTTQGISLLETWLAENPNLKVCLLVMVYPACATRQTDLRRLLEVADRASDRVFVHICPLEQVTDRGTNAICFVGRVSDAAHVVIGPSENLGLDPRQNGHVNFVFRADPVTVEAFKRYFDWLWGNSRKLTANGTALIPELFLPEGSDEGARLWLAYLSDSIDGTSKEDTPATIADVNPDTGDVAFRLENGTEIPALTEELGLKKLDQLSERIARIYERGSLVSIDKLSRIPPLDAPLDPSPFGDASELQQGNVTRTVRIRVSVIDENTLKEIDKRRQGLRTLLTKFTFGLADNMRWMPTAARNLFESELKRINEEGQKLISDLLKGDVDAFVNAKHETLVADINGMYRQLGRPGQVTADVIARVEGDLKSRLRKAQSANFMPTLSYSSLNFSSTDTAFSSPWGQAYSLLSDIAAFPRKALSDSFFFRGLKVSKRNFIEAMDVADDVLCHELGSVDVEDRCKAELNLLSRIEKAPLESKARCELVCKILDGDEIESIEHELKKKDLT